MTNYSRVSNKGTCTAIYFLKKIHPVRCYEILYVNFFLDFQFEKLKNIVFFKVKSHPEFLLNA